MPATLHDSCFARVRVPFPHLLSYARGAHTVADSGKPEDFSKAQIFALTAIDGHSIHDSFQASRQASYNQGPKLTLSITERQIPAHAVKVKLRASHITGMHIHEFASRAVGSFYEVEGVVDFKPAAEAKYVVNGQLSKNSSSVWIEDAITHEVVTEKVTSK